VSDDFYLKTPPLNHPDWRPYAFNGHYCVAERWCPCGHWGAGRRATRRVDGKRGLVTLDRIEESGGDGAR
jgi:hypothetical protein